MAVRRFYFPNWFPLATTIRPIIIRSHPFIVATTITTTTITTSSIITTIKTIATTTSITTNDDQPTTPTTITIVSTNFTIISTILALLQSSSREGFQNGWDGVVVILVVDSVPHIGCPRQLGPCDKTVGTVLKTVTIVSKMGPYA